MCVYIQWIRLYNIPHFLSKGLAGSQFVKLYGWVFHVLGMFLCFIMHLPAVFPFPNPLRPTSSIMNAAFALLGLLEKEISSLHAPSYDVTVGHLLVSGA